MARRRHSSPALLTFCLAGLFLGLFLVWPVVEAVAGAFLDAGGHFTWNYLAEVLRNPIYLEGLRNALGMGLGSTVLAFGLALPLAWIQDRFDFRGKGWLTGLVLVPMVSGAQSIAHELEDEDTVWIGYPLPALHQLFSGGAEPARVADLATRDHLPPLIGGVRARLLRALDRPTTIGDLAAVGDWAMSSVSRHCDWLAGAGLIERTRRGRTVLVQRTLLGNELVELFAH